MNRDNTAVSWRWLALIVIIALVRLALSGDRDILATNSPHDEFWYIYTAYQKIWLGTYSEMAFMHPPIYSMWLTLLSTFGIPLRLAIDVSWILAVSYLAYAIQRLTGRTWLSMVVAIFLAFHPYTISIFDRALAETLLTVLCAAALGAAIELWNCRESDGGLRRWTALVLYTGAVALAFHIRKEGIVLLIPLLILAGWSWIDRKTWWNGGRAKLLGVPLIISPFLAIILLGLALSSMNYLKWGIFARYDLASSGYTRAVAALNSIDAGPTPHHVTVTRTALSLAYRESQNFRELQPYLEGSVGQMWRSISAPFVSVPGEIGNGWFYWALRDSAGRAGWHSNAGIADRKYAAVADDLEAAFKSGRLKKKGYALFAFLDPDLAKWLPDVPSGVVNVMRLVVWPQYVNVTAPSENATKEQFDLYARIAGRRSAPDEVTVRGWVISPAGTLIGIGAPSTGYTWTRLSDQVRPDVRGARAFDISYMGVGMPSNVKLLLPDGRISEILLGNLKVGEVSALQGEVSATIGIDALATNARLRHADKLLPVLCKAYEWAGYVICVVVAMAVLMLTVASCRRLAAALVLVAMLAAIAGRVMLFGILDASSWSGLQARYVLPTIPFIAGAAAMAFVLLSRAWENSRSLKRAHL